MKCVKTLVNVPLRSTGLHPENRCGTNVRMELVVSMHERIFNSGWTVAKSEVATEVDAGNSPLRGSRTVLQQRCDLFLRTCERIRTLRGQGGWQQLSGSLVPVLARSGRPTKAWIRAMGARKSSTRHSGMQASVLQIWAMGGL